LVEYKAFFYMALQVERQRRCGKALASLYREAAPVASLTYLKSAGSAGTLRQFPSLLTTTTMQATFIRKSDRAARVRAMRGSKKNNLVLDEREAV
jgi:hypothetical protein